MKAVIVCNGAIKDYTCYGKYLKDADVVICTDGGATHLKRLGIIPDVLLGDFDSIATEDLRYFEDKGASIVRYPVEKDKTDTELAVEYAIEIGCGLIIIIGGFGTRLDHSLANIFLLKSMLDRGVRGIIADESNEIMLTDGHIRLEGQPGNVISLIPLTQKTENVTTKGLRYRLDGAVISMGSTWGVSNEFIGETAEVSVGKGLLLVIRSRD